MLISEDPDATRTAVQAAVHQARLQGSQAVNSVIRQLGDELAAAGLQDARATAESLVAFALTPRRRPDNRQSDV